MGLLANGLVCCPLSFVLLFVAAISAAASAEDRCKDESFCKAYCSSTNPETVSARCGRDMASCICVTPDNYAVKVRFIEQRNPVPPTPSTTPRPTFNGVKYVNSQSMPNAQYNNYNGNGNSIAGGQSQSNQQQNQPQSAGPVLLECDGSDTSTRMCHFFCTVEIRAWYGLCNTTSTACSCFGIPLSAVQQEPITAIFHSTAPATPAPRTTPKPYTPPRPDYQQLYPQHQYLQQQPQPQPQVQQQKQQQWTPLPSSASYQAMYNNNQFYPASSPTTLNAVAAHSNPTHEQFPVRSTASLFGSNGQPISPSILTPSDHIVGATLKASGSSIPTAAQIPSDVSSSTDTDAGTTVPDNEDDLEPTTIKTTRRRRSINDTPVKDSSKRKNIVTAVKDSLTEDDSCSKYKCAISCKRNNYLAPDCEPKCIDGQCWCECFPRL